MSKLALRISQQARSDIVDILRYSETRFGEHARRRYQHLLQATLRAITQNPERVGSMARDELAPGLRSLHLFHCRSAVAGAKSLRPRHMIFYRSGPDEIIEIVRILHDGMELALHLPPTLTP
ncbi:type II toxin-antitoxin system RelE/ParE family toxin [Pseudomonas xanthosomatis]|uniref:type II toxin-antitoxin system RelE/ParE family toxin n=1 Tax=Pseudomonas xanthosomatis TaxID=2842356 RepID=UPI003517CC0D